MNKLIAISLTLIFCILNTYNYAQLFPVKKAVSNSKSMAGFIDNTGKQIIPYIYDYAETFSEDLCFVKKDGLGGYINSTGKLVIPFKYQDGRHFNNGYASVFIKNDDYLIDRNGNEFP